MGNEEELIDAIRVGERTLEGMGVVSKVMLLMREIEKRGCEKFSAVAEEQKAWICCVTIMTQKFGALPIRLGEEGVRLDT